MEAIKSYMRTPVLYLGVLAATLWDFRVNNLRIFDLAAIGLLGFWLLMNEEFGKTFFQRRRRYWLLYAAIIVYALAGYILHRHNSSLAILFLAIFGFCLVGRKDWWEQIGPIFWPLVYFHLPFFFIQLVGFYGFGVTIDFLTSIGGSTQILLSNNLIRPTGLFREVHSFCGNTFVLTSLAILWRPSRIGALIVGGTLIISESLWGFGAGLMVLCLNEYRMNDKFEIAFAKIAASGTAIILAAIGYFWLHKTAYNEGLPYFAWRLTTLLDDPSLQTRYFDSCAIASDTIPDRVRASWTLADTLIGNGLTTSHFIQCLPANGIALLAKSFGLLGIGLLVAGMVQSLRDAPTANKLYIAAVLLFSFTSYPLVTYVLFWIWIAGLLTLSTRTSTAAKV